MTLLTRKLCALSATVLVGAGCSQPTQGVNVSVHQAPELTRLDSVEVVRIATEAAERAGRDLGQYEAPRIRFELTGRTWWVTWEGIVAQPGNHFGVSVDDQTGKTQLFGGS